MFNNKNDPVADTIKGIMNRTALRNKVEEALNEQLGVSSRKAIPHEYLAQYDAMLAEQHAQAEKKTGASKPTEGDEAEAGQFQSTREISGDRTETRGPDYLEKLNNQGSYTLPAREGKAVSPLKNLQEKLSPKQKKLAAKAGNPNKIEDVDLKKLRKDKTLDEQQLQEKATEEEKEKVARVMREYEEGKLHSGSKKGPKVTKKKQAVAIAMSQAGLSNKKKMDESLQSIQEEIRNNLIQKLNYIYESEGEDAANAYFETLSEQERGILSEVEAKLSGVIGTGPGSYRNLDKSNAPRTPFYAKQVAQRAAEKALYTQPTATPPATPAAQSPSSTTRFANMARGVANMARGLGPPGSIASMIPASFGRNYIEPALHNIGLGKILNVPNAPTGNESIKGSGNFVPNRRFVPPKSQSNTPTPSKPAATSDVIAMADNERAVDTATSKTPAARPAPEKKVDPYGDVGVPEKKVDPYGDVGVPEKKVDPYGDVGVPKQGTPAARPAPASTPTPSARPATAPATSSQDSKPDWRGVGDGGSGSPFASEPSTTRSVRQAPERNSSSSFSRATRGDFSGITGSGGA